MGEYEVSPPEYRMLVKFFKKNKNRRGTQDLQEVSTTAVKLHMVDLLGSRRNFVCTHTVQRLRATA